MDRFWNKGDFYCIAELLTADYVDHAYVPNDREGLLNIARIRKRQACRSMFGLQIEQITKKRLVISQLAVVIAEGHE